MVMHRNADLDRDNNFPALFDIGNSQGDDPAVFILQENVISLAKPPFNI